MPKPRKRKSPSRGKARSRVSRKKPVLENRTGCCPRINKAYWDRRVWKWDAKPFYRVHFFSFFHMPLGFGKIFTEEIPKLQKKGLVSKKKDDFPMCLVRNEGMWGGDMYIEVQKTDPNVNSEHMAILSGRFFSMVFEGSYREMPQWIERLEKEARKKKYRVGEILSLYCTCPKCAKVYGNVQAVLFARVE